MKITSQPGGGALASPKSEEMVWSLSYNPDLHKRTKAHTATSPLSPGMRREGRYQVRLGEENPADMLTKPVTGARLTALKRLAGMMEG